jgi:hypothetical protein
MDKNNIMFDRDLKLTELRPPIPSIIEENATSTAEQFQNRTLRPILKLQNDLLIQIFQQYTIHRKGIFQNLSQSKQLEYIGNSIRKDLKFRSQLIGCIVGHFTLEEWKLYIQEENELRKRMVGMLVERIKNEMVKR